MKITFDTLKPEEVEAVLQYLLSVTLQDDTHSVTESTLEAPKKEKVTPSIPKEEKAVEAPVEKKVTPKKTEVKVTLNELKDIAKNATTKVDRIEVKNTIGKYASKLAEVKPEDYAKLAEELKALGA